MNDELKCTIISLVPFELLEYKPGLIPPAFLIEASDGETPTILHVGNSLHYVYLDDTRGSLPVRGPSDVVARSIVTDYIESQLGVGDNSRPGIFWVPGEWNLAEIRIKFKDQLEKAKKDQENWFTACCRIADDDWNKYHQHNVISSAQRKMAVMLGWDPKQHEWMAPKSVQDASSAKCFACFSVLNNPEQMVCHVCKAVLKQSPELSFAK